MDIGKDFYKHIALCCTKFTDRQTNRQTDKLTNRQTNKQTNLSCCCCCCWYQCCMYAAYIG